MTIHAVRLTLRAGGRLLLHNGALSVATGERVLVTGPNGAGKSLLGQTLVGLWPGGSVVIDGLPVTQAKGRRRVGYLPQEPRFYGYLSVEENLHFYAGLAGVGRRIRTKVVPDLLELVGLRRLAEREANRLTPGQAQRLAVARSLVGDPPALVLDEPLAGLDAEGRAELHQLLQELAQMGKAILILAADPDGFRVDRRLSLQGGYLTEEVGA